MGSTSDWDTMRHAAEVLKEFGVPHECAVVSAHRTPQWMAEFAAGAAARGLEVVIAGAGGAAHLPGMIAAQTLLPVLGVPVGTLAIGRAGATNAALLAVAILANTRPELRERLRRFREEQTARVREAVLPS
ncbi:MAG: AIR carboxylase family protein [Pyrinomonadaceae bacterium]